MSVKVDSSEAKRKLEGAIAKLLAVPVAALEVAEEAKERLAELTPRSAGEHGGPHTADLWEVRVGGGPQARGASGRFLAKGQRVKVGQGQTRVEINHPFNTPGAVHPATKAIVNDGKHNLLASLEWGTREHEIAPISPGGYVTTPGKKGREAAPPAGFLKFTIGGRTIFARRVVVPAMRPHGMVRITRDEAHARFRARVAELLRQP